MSKLSRFIDKKILNPIRSTYLCIRYPFLYPRNRFTDKHYNNWKLHHYHVDNYIKAVNCLLVRIYSKDEWLNEEKINTKKLSLSSEGGYYYKIRNDFIKIYCSGKFIDKINMRDITEYYSGIYNIGFVNDCYFCVVFDDNTKINNKRILFINHIVDKWLYFKIKCVDFLNDYILQVFHCIPTHTEIDAMKNECPGWYKRFGKQLLVDMKNQLKKDKMLYSFRIMQIKEKWGRFCLYCGAATHEMYELLDKYGTLSEHICIDCGKDADIITSPYGWQCPYCNNCYNKNHNWEAIQYKKETNGNWIEIDAGE